MSDAEAPGEPRYYQIHTGGSFYITDATGGPYCSVDTEAEAIDEVRLLRAMGGVGRRGENLIQFLALRIQDLSNLIAETHPPKNEVPTLPEEHSRHGDRQAPGRQGREGEERGQEQGGRSEHPQALGEGEGREVATNQIAAPQAENARLRAALEDALRELPGVLETLREFDAPTGCVKRMMEELRAALQPAGKPVEQPIK